MAIHTPESCPYLPFQQLRVPPLPFPVRRPVRRSRSVRPPARPPARPNERTTAARSTDRLVLSGPGPFKARPSVQFIRPVRPSVHLHPAVTSVCKLVSAAAAAPFLTSCAPTPSPVECSHRCIFAHRALSRRQVPAQEISHIALIGAVVEVAEKHLGNRTCKLTSSIFRRIADETRPVAHLGSGEVGHALSGSRRAGPKKRVMLRYFVPPTDLCCSYQNIPDHGDAWKVQIEVSEKPSLFMAPTDNKGNATDRIRSPSLHQEHQE